MSEQEQNIAIVRRWAEEVLNRPRKDSVIDELMNLDCTIHGSYTVGTGPDAYRQALAMILRGLPDYFYEIEDVFAVGDKVVARAREGGTHKGEFLGIPATGKRVCWSAITILRLAEGKLVEVWGTRSLLEFVKKVGAAIIPGEGQS